MHILLLGNDPRQNYACEYFRYNDIESDVFAKDMIDDHLRTSIKKASHIVFPMPISVDGINVNGTNIAITNIIDIISPCSCVFGGKTNSNIKKLLDHNKIKYYDLSDFSTFQIKNALLSAEGAIYYASNYYHKSIYGSQISILGFGRIAKTLSFLLKAHGAEVCICARRSEDIAWAEMLGFDTVLIDDHWGENFTKKRYDIIFNTIPCNIMSEYVVKMISSNSLIIDLASYPYGIDRSLADKYCLDYHIESAIPGRYAPQSAGILLAQTIMNIINAKEENL